MILPSSNISFSMVCRAIGTYTSDLGTLCLSPNININSKHKPVSYPTTAGITEQELKEVNYGFNIDSNHNTLFTTDLATILNAAKNNDGWYYKRPFGTAQSPYRLGDFRGLNTDAEPFWERTIGESGTTEINLLQLQAGVNTNGDIKPLDFTPITQANQGDWYYMALYREEGGAASLYLSTVDPLIFDGDYNEDAYADIPVISSSSIKRYECCLILAKYDAENQIITDALLVPNSYRAITYNSNYTPFTIAINYDNDPLFASTVSADYCNSFTYRFDILNALTGITNFELTIKIKDDGGDLWSSTYSSATLSDGLITGTVNCNFYKGDDAELDIYQVYATLSYTYQGSTRTKYFNFASEAVSSVAAYESGRDFFEQYCVAHS